MGQLKGVLKRGTRMITGPEHVLKEKIKRTGFVEFREEKGTGGILTVFNTV